MGTTLGLYFPMDNDDANALRARLNRLAGELGYTARGGPTTGEGNLAALLVGIDKGEVIVVKSQASESVEQMYDLGKQNGPKRA